jgi:hypothetical protein
MLNKSIISNASSNQQLYNLSEQLHIPKLVICRLKDVPKYLKNKNIDNIIINLDNFGHGTHWVGLNKPKKIYFDSYAQDKPKEIPNNYKLASTSKELQSITAEDCGWLTTLWLYYINFKTNDEYYNLFKDIY